MTRRYGFETSPHFIVAAFARMQAGRQHFPHSGECGYDYFAVVNCQLCRHSAPLTITETVA